MELQVPDVAVSTSGVTIDARCTIGGVTYCASLSSSAAPFKIPHRVVDLQCWRMHGVLLSDSGAPSLQVRAFVYRLAGRADPIVECWIGNSSLDRALGDIACDFEVSILVDGQVVDTHAHSGGLMYDGTGYWLRYGSLPLNPDMQSADIVEIPPEARLHEIDEANLGWDVPDVYPGFLPGWHPIHGDTRKWVIVTNTNTTGSPMSVGALPREVGGLQALLLPSPKSLSQCWEMLDALLQFAAQQGRRPYHYYHDSGRPFLCADHPKAVLGQSGWSTLWSAKELFGRQAKDLPTLPQKNPYNGGDSHHFETDRLAWGYLLTGSMMCLEQLLSLVEGQRAYPMWKAPTKVSNPRPWAWALRAATWCQYIHHRLEGSGVDLAWTTTSKDVENLCGAFALSTKLDGVGTQNGLFYVFPDGADKRHLYPFPEDVKQFADMQYGLEMPTPGEGHEAYADLLGQLAAEPKEDKRREIEYKISDYLMDYLAANRGKEAVYALKDLYAFVPVDQVAIAIMACLHVQRLCAAAADLSFSATAGKVRDFAIIFLVYLWTRGRAQGVAGGTYWNDVGAYLPWKHNGDGTGADGTQEWKSGALVAIAHLFSWLPVMHRAAITEFALPLLRGNAGTQVNKPAFYTWGWYEQFFPRG